MTFEKRSDEMRWSVECGVWSVKCVMWRVHCEVWSVELQVWHLEQCTTFVQSTHARNWLAHGARTFYRWQGFHIITLRRLPPCLVRALLVFPVCSLFPLHYHYCIWLVKLHKFHIKQVGACWPLVFSHACACRCDDHWCYVDPANCYATNEPSSRYDAHWSYTTCGFLLAASLNKYLNLTHQTWDLEPVKICDLSNK